jgi:hypothetical protein
MREVEFVLEGGGRRQVVVTSREVDVGESSGCGGGGMMRRPEAVATSPRSPNLRVKPPSLVAPLRAGSNSAIYIQPRDVALRVSASRLVSASPPLCVPKPLNTHSPSFISTLTFLPDSLSPRHVHLQPLLHLLLLRLRTRSRRLRRWCPRHELRPPSASLDVHNPQLAPRPGAIPQPRRARCGAAADQVRDR